MFFSFLSYLPKEQQTKIIDNWVKMRKDYEIKQKKLEIERIEKEKENKKLEQQEKIIQYLRENPPTTFRDMMVAGPFMAEYYKKKMCDKNTQYDENDILNNEKQNNSLEEENYSGEDTFSEVESESEDDVSEEENNSGEDDVSEEENNSEEETQQKSWFSW